MAEQTLVKEPPVEDIAVETVEAEQNGVTDTEKLQVEVKDIEVVIDLDGLLIGDLELLDRAKDGNLPMMEIITFLDRIVIGEVKKLPIRYFSVIIDKLGDAIADSANPGN